MLLIHFVELLVATEQQYSEISCSSSILSGQEFCVCLLCAKSLQSDPTLCDPVDYCPPGSSVHGILQARIL